MRRSTDRVLTMHAGSLPRPDDVREMVAARADGRPYDEGVLNERLRGAVADIVRQQTDCGLDSINDGELGKTNFTNYANERLSGLEVRVFGPNEGPEPQQISARDRLVFPGYFDTVGGRAAGRPRDRQLFCVDRLAYTGGDRLQDDRIRALRDGLLHAQVPLARIALTIEDRHLDPGLGCRLLEPGGDSTGELVREDEDVPDALARQGRHVQRGGRALDGDRLLPGRDRSLGIGDALRLRVGCRRRLGLGLIGRRGLGRRWRLGRGRRLVCWCWLGRGSRLGCRCGLGRWRRFRCGSRLRSGCRWGSGRRARRVIIPISACGGDQGEHAQDRENVRESSR